MADGITINGGTWSLAGQSVAIVIAGLDCGNFTLAADGTIFVPFGSDPDGLLTASYLNSVSNPNSTVLSLTAIPIKNGSGTTILTVYVPVIVGYNYQSQGQMLRAISQNATKSPQGGGSGRLRRVADAAVLVVNGQGLQLGTSIGTVNNMTPVVFRQLDGTALTKDVLYTGDYFGALDDSSSFDGFLSWQIIRPYPCTITSLTAFIEVPDR